MTETNKSEPIFADGIMFARANEKAPEWVKGKVSVNIEKFLAFLKTQRAAGNISSKGWLNLDLKESKGGVLYFQVDTYKSPETQRVEEIKQQISNITSKGHNGEEIDPELVPF